MEKHIDNLADSSERPIEFENFSIPVSAAALATQLYSQFNGGNAVNYVYRSSRFEWLNKLIHFIDGRCD